MTVRRAGLVSVVVTCFNRKHYIVPCLNALAAQSYKNMEIIVVDDGSGDGSWAQIQDWKRHLPITRGRSVVAVRLPRNTGYSGALTTGMFLARGEFIAIQDSDDVSHRDRIRKQVLYLRNHPHIGMVGSNYALLQSGKVRPAQSGWLRFGWPNIRKSYRAGKHCMSVGTLLMRGRYFDKWGGLTRRVNGAEDWEIVANYIGHGVRVDNMRDVLYYYRVHRTQRSRRFYGRK